MLRGTHTPYASATEWSMSESGAKPRLYFWSQAARRLCESGLMSTMTVPPTEPAASRSPHTWAVHPGALAFAWK